MQPLYSYRNTERSARYIAKPAPTEAERLASQIAFMEKRKAELSRELTVMVKAREKAIQRLAYERKVAEAEMDRQRKAFANEVLEHETRIAGILSGMNKHKPNPKARPENTISVDVVANRICRALKVDILDVVSAKRDAPIAFARQAICYWAYRRAGFSSAQLGRFLYLDHSTVLHAVRVYPKKRVKMGRKVRALR